MLKPRKLKGTHPIKRIHDYGADGFALDIDIEEVA